MTPEELLNQATIGALSRNAMLHEAMKAAGNVSMGIEIALREDDGCTSEADLVDLMSDLEYAKGMLQGVKNLGGGR